MRSPRLEDWRWSRALLTLAVVGALTLVAGELGARIDDRVERNIPLAANPTYESELRVRKDGLLQGRPFGHYHKWLLNSWGFRSPEIAVERRPGCQRVMVLGASEMFGLYESPGQDFSAILLDRLSAHGCFEVINAAMAGLGLASARTHWYLKLAAFRPDIALIYPTPVMNINDSSPGSRPSKAAGAQPVKKADADTPGARSRLVDRLREYVHTPQVIDDWEIRRSVAAQQRTHPAHWVQSSPPVAGLESFTTQLGALVGDVEASGTKVILMTHAGRVTSDTLATDPHDATWMQADVPNVTPAAQLAFTAIANEHIRSLAAKRGDLLLDLDRLLSGCLACFVDPAHFTDRGAYVAASAAASMVLDSLSKTEASGHEKQTALISQAAQREIGGYRSEYRIPGRPPH